MRLGTSRDFVDEQFNRNGIREGSENRFESTMAGWWKRKFTSRLIWLSCYSFRFVFWFRRHRIKADKILERSSVCGEAMESFMEAN